jgi:hypothetical protein
MQIGDVAIVFATLLGPILAVQAQRWIDVHRERRKARDQLFRSLMATRGAILSPEHVRALNLIELEFGKSQSQRQIIEAWRAYLTHLNTKMSDDEAWGNKRVDLLVEMLHEMANYLGYPFDKTQIRTSAYAPVAHSTLEEEGDQIRKLFVKLLRGESALAITEARAIPEVKPPMRMIPPMHN